MSLYADKTQQNLGGGSFLATPEVGVVQNIERYFCERIMRYIVVSGKFGGMEPEC